MSRKCVLDLLKNHQAELRELGVRSLALFGSVARDQSGPGSDVDLLVEFSGLPSFDRFMDVKIYLDDLARIFSWQETRILSKNLTLCHAQCPGYTLFGCPG